MSDSTHRDLTHLDAEGRARMVDISAKADSTRIAVAAGELVTTPEVIALVRADDMPKADVLPTARIAGISAAKKTSELIPLCHQVPLSSVHITFGFTDTSITIEARAKTRGATGVEMEALTAVAVAGLTLHDMVKALDPAAQLNNVHLVSKEGGKRGQWTRASGDQPEPLPAPRSAAVIVASTRAAEGTREDATGPQIAAWLTERGFDVDAPRVCADADIAAALADVLALQPAVIVTTGGTGVSPTDLTPEATRVVLDRELPGVADAIRARGAEVTPHAALSRGLAGVSNRTLIVNLPGSPSGVRDGLGVLEPILDHLLAQISGGGNHDD
ncbi:MAG: bifunctional molybdenum cofactor biosynthesis protein MoaC/MoaB [Rhodococcus sp.]|nr:bifunctional molybdenum cofactor biosynthesis protein MoaC/MoaB [Rhodococcus sp. (in: high G+C Gram-positive bacteria)]